MTVKIRFKGFKEYVLRQARIVFVTGAVLCLLRGFWDMTKGE